MMKTVGILSVFFAFATIQVSNATIFTNGNVKTSLLDGNIYYYEDKTNGLDIEDVRLIDFEKFPEPTHTINLGHSKSSFWFKFNIQNTSKSPLYCLYGIENSNLDEVEVYIFEDGKLIDQFITGESRKTSTRDLAHRHLLFRAHLNPNIGYTYYTRIMNNGDELAIPMIFEQSEGYFASDGNQILITGLFNGLFLMIFVFTLFLYLRLKEKVYLYYSLYVLLSTFFVLGGDGLLSFLMPPYFTVRIKLMFMHMAMYFLILFTQAFYKSSKVESYHFPLYFNILKITSIVGAILTYLPYPYRLSSIYIGTVTAPIIFITIVLVSIILYKKEYYTSFYTAAFIFSLSSVIVYIMYDYGMFSNNMLTKNSLKIGKALEGILLTLAVVERFKFNENLDKLLIKDRSEKIEAQKQTLMEINDQLEKLSIVASETDNAIAIYNEKHEMEWCNAAFERIHECTMAELFLKYGKNIRDLSSHEDLDLILSDCLLNKKSVRFQSRRVFGSNKELWTQTTLTPYIDAQGKVVKLISIDTNITQLKEIQKELILSRDKAEESDKLKSAFLSNISHEIRTPLNAILGFSELLLLDKSDTKKRFKYLEMIRNNGRHLLKLISDIIDISRIEAGEIKLELFKGNINKLMKEMHSQYQVELESNLSKDVEIRQHLDLPDSESEVFIDHYKIKQVFTNLLNNAIKFTLSGYIETGYIIEDKKFKFYVKDTGIGIDEEHQRLIFQRFRQVELGLSRKYEGAGLGLTLSKGLVEKMGGKIWVESAIGKGSTFYFTVPFEPIKTKPYVETKIETAYDFEGKKILIVEDTLASRELIHEMLSDTGATIEDAGTGKLALQMAEENHYDAILMDIRLPDINGYDVTRMIRKNNKEVYILAQTANAMDDEKNKCFEAGCNDYISKPFDYDSLLKLLQSKMEHKKG
jgi:signal transduction histidine kinase/ActR/RegA family two-component response regulator